MIILAAGASPIGELLRAISGIFVAIAILIGVMLFALKRSAKIEGNPKAARKYHLGMAALYSLSSLFGVVAAVRDRAYFPSPVGLLVVSLLIWGHLRAAKIAQNESSGKMP